MKLNIKKFFTSHQSPPASPRQSRGRAITYHQPGFTLLEILVVISIIGLLIAMGSVSYSTAQKKGRDARRKGDIKAIQNALEEYYSVNSTYPGGTYPNGINTYISGGTIPVDPKNASAYCATAYSTTTYTVCGDLESDAFAGNCSDNDFCINALQ